MKNKGRQVVLAAALINFFTGMMYAWSIVSKTLVANMGWSSKEASLPYTVFTVVFPVSMVIFGKFQDKYGPKVSGLLGATLVGIGFVSAGIFLSPIWAIVSIGIISGMGVGIITISTTPPAIKWFHPSKKGKITGIVVAGVGLSALFYSPLATYLIGVVGIQKTLTCIGIIVLVIAVALATRLQNPPSDFKFEQIKGKSSEQIEIDYKGMLRTKEFYLLWLLLGLSSSAGLMVISHISNIAFVQSAFTNGFIIVMIISVFNSLGRILGGSISDKIGRVSLMRMLFMIQAVNMLVFTAAASPLLLIICASITGLIYGAGFSVFPAAIGDLYGTKNFGLNYGLLFTGWGFGGIIGPMTGAAIYDLNGTYTTAFIVSAVLLAICLALSFVFNKEKAYEN